MVCNLFLLWHKLASWFIGMLGREGEKLGGLCACRIVGYFAGCQFICCAALRVCLKSSSCCYYHCLFLLVWLEDWLTEGRTDGRLVASNVLFTKPTYNM